MNKEKVFCLAKKLTASVLATGMVVAGIAVYPKQAEAAVVEDKVIYEVADVTTYWKVDSKTAPVKEGYVFGGWFQVVDTNIDGAEAFEDGETITYYAPLTAADLNTDEDNECDYTGTAYAKFVPAQVLSVKAQNKAGTGDTVTDNTHVRIISSLDSKNYEKVGFDIWLANSVQLFKDAVEGEPLETDKIYDGLLVGENKEEVHATTIFGGVSKYVSVWQLNNIDSAHWGKIIYVRPYWITMDGTKVEGLAKYVHIEDDYEGYISVPVNLLNKETAAKVAAGTVNMTYSNAEGKDVALTFEEVEAGRLLPEMSSTQSGNVIKMVGNAKNVNEYNNKETLYANIRFKKLTDATDVDVDFNIDMVQFCDWNEDDVTIKEKWDVKYDAKEITSE